MELDTNKFKNIYLVKLIGSERGWGQEVYDKKIFDNETEAKMFVLEFNSKNTEAVAPDYYTVAEYVGKVI